MFNSGRSTGGSSISVEHQSPSSLLTFSMGLHVRGVTHVHSLLNHITVRSLH
ncbi:hypothetical protein D4764_14G0002550 [Takifugu flavidus]|uniref:Uncharacterized protein n=1 Tax=Takifugu flavidus TaxID=433684 RepID=A0A5C6P376_9TELE|nr:hypothetical protein D4764_14G0002550 [Takifugu flavidus]